MQLKKTGRACGKGEGRTVLPQEVRISELLRLNEVENAYKRLVHPMACDAPQALQCMHRPIGRARKALAQRSPIVGAENFEGIFDCL